MDHDDDNEEEEWGKDYEDPHWEQYMRELNNPNIENGKFPEHVFELEENDAAFPTEQPPQTATPPAKSTTEGDTHVTTNIPTPTTQHTPPTANAPTTASGVVDETPSNNDDIIDLDANIPGKQTANTQEPDNINENSEDEDEQAPTSPSSSGYRRLRDANIVGNTLGADAQAGYNFICCGKYRSKLNQFGAVMTRSRGMTAYMISSMSEPVSFLSTFGIYGGISQTLDGWADNCGDLEIGLRILLIVVMLMVHGIWMKNKLQNDHKLRNESKSRKVLYALRHFALASLEMLFISIEPFSCGIDERICLKVFSSIWWSIFVIYVGIEIKRKCGKAQ